MVAVPMAVDKGWKAGTPCPICGEPAMGHAYLYAVSSDTRIEPGTPADGETYMHSQRDDCQRGNEKLGELAAKNE